MTDSPPTAPRRGIGWFAALAVVATVGSVAAVALLLNIFERKQEARSAFTRIVELTEDTSDPSEWGKNFPHQYDAYRRTVDQVRTRFGGSEALPRVPTDSDPRTVVTHFPAISGKSAATPTCWMIRPLPSARPSASPARVPTAMPRRSRPG